MRALKGGAGWPASVVAVVGFLTAASVFRANGQGAPVSGEAAETMALREFGGYGYALRKVVPISQLPARIGYLKGEISLVVDPLDRVGPYGRGEGKPYQAVYLVNDTDDAIPGIIGELQKVRSEVEFGGHWYSREPREMVCASVPPPTDLPARHALALGGVDSQWGDTGGAIRYVFGVPNRTIRSEPQRGRYFANDLMQVMAKESWTRDLREPLEEGLIKQRWSGSMLANSDEEFCALMELVRNHELAIPDRARIMDWLLERAEKRDATPQKRLTMRRIAEVLAKPWVIDHDGQTLADRCVAALEAKPSHSYGTPEKCRACVWRLVAARTPSAGPHFAQYDRRPADEATIARLVELAERDLGSDHPEVGDAAAGFLGNGRIAEELFPSHKYLGWLSSDRIRRIQAGLTGLSARQRTADAGPWLRERIKANDPLVHAYYKASLTYHHSGIQDWERDVLDHLIRVQPLETLVTLSVNSGSASKEKLSGEFMEFVRGFLNDQLTDERRQWWREAAERDLKGNLELTCETDCQGLKNGIRILDSLDDPADTPLLLALLDHPAANANFYSDGSGTLFFVAREAAAVCLKRRKIRIPDGLVTTINLPPPAPSAGPTTGFVGMLVRHKVSVIVVVLAVMCAGSLLLANIRLRRRPSTEAPFQGGRAP